MCVCVCVCCDLIYDSILAYMPLNYHTHTHTHTTHTYTYYTHTCQSSVCTSIYMHTHVYPLLFVLVPQHGETGLHIAAKYAHAEVVNAFAEGRANMNVMMEVGFIAVIVRCVCVCVCVCICV